MLLNNHLSSKVSRAQLEQENILGPRRRQTLSHEVRSPKGDSNQQRTTWNARGQDTQRAECNGSSIQLICNPASAGLLTPNTDPANQSSSGPTILGTNRRQLLTLKSSPGLLHMGDPSGDTVTVERQWPFSLSLEGADVVAAAAAAATPVEVVDPSESFV